MHARFLSCWCHSALVSAALPSDSELSTDAREWLLHIRRFASELIKKANDTIHCRSQVEASSVATSAPVDEGHTCKAADASGALRGQGSITVDEIEEVHLLAAGDHAARIMTWLQVRQCMFCDPREEHSTIVDFQSYWAASVATAKLSVIWVVTPHGGASKEKSRYPINLLSVQAPLPST